MKKVVLLIPLLLSGCAKQTYFTLPTSIPEIKNVEQLDTTQNTYLAKINIDIYKPENTALNDSLRKAASANYASLKEEIESDTGAKYEYGKQFIDEFKNKSETQVIEEFVKADLNTINNEFLFKIFANKKYFESKVSDGKCTTRATIQERILELKRKINSTGLNVLEPNIDSALINSDPMSSQLPVAAFLLRERDEPRWLIISAWEYDERVLGDKEESNPTKCISMEHIRGVLYDITLAHEIGSFSCM